MKNTFLILLMLIGGLGCTEVSNTNEAHLKGSEKVSFKVEKDIYTCSGDEFFYIERSNKVGFINFIYGSYSTPLLQKPSTKSTLFSDGVYNLFITKNLTQVFMDNEVVLDNCKKT